MKRMFSSRTIFITATTFLLIGNIVLVLMLKITRIAASELKTDLNENEHYYQATINQLMNLDVSGLKEGDLKLCVYLSLAACNECNDKTLTFACTRFNKEELCVVVDEKYRNALPAYLKQSDCELLFEKDSYFFKSAVPFFFFKINGQAVLKFTHDNDHPELSELYFSKIVYYFKKIKSNV